LLPLTLMSLIVVVSSIYTNILPRVSALSTSNTNATTTGNNLPTAQSIFDTGIMSLPQSVKGFLMYILDEAHHPPSDDKMISPQNANYILTHLIMPKGTAISFVHGDPGHVHIELVKDSNTNQVVWQTTPIKHLVGLILRYLPLDPTVSLIVNTIQ
jgi:hypothetical protein